MTEEEKENLIHSLWAEWRDVIGAAANDEKKYAFIVGARAAIVAMEERTRKPWYEHDQAPAVRHRPPSR
jgi:hypothetical protein